MKVVNLWPRAHPHNTAQFGKGLRWLCDNGHVHRTKTSAGKCEKEGRQ